MTFKFQIKARFTGAVMFEAELDASFESRPGSVKLGEAVKAAYLEGANLRGANLGKDFNANSLIARVTRITDTYEFFAFDTDKGIVIKAGCRLMLLSDYRAHIADNYPNTEKARETTDILDFIEMRAEKVLK